MSSGKDEVVCDSAEEERNEGLTIGSEGVGDGSGAELG